MHKTIASEPGTLLGLKLESIEPSNLLKIQQHAVSANPNMYLIEPVETVTSSTQPTTRPSAVSNEHSTEKELLFSQIRTGITRVRTANVLALEISPYRRAFIEQERTMNANLTIKKEQLIASFRNSPGDQMQDAERFLTEKHLAISAEKNLFEQIEPKKRTLDMITKIMDLKSLSEVLSECKKAIAERTIELSPEK